MCVCVCVCVCVREREREREREKERERERIKRDNTLKMKFECSPKYTANVWNILATLNIIWYVLFPFVQM